MKSRLVGLLSELWQIGREGTFVGAVRFIRLKRMGGARQKAWRLSAAPASGLGILGAGNYLMSVHLACLKALGAPLYAIVSRSGDSARAVARVYGIGAVHRTAEEMFSDERCDAFLIATPHNLHPQHILLALTANVYTYCEKPAAIDSHGVELLEHEATAHPSAHKLMIGFNRRFAPAVQRLRRVAWLRERAHPIEVHYRVNFGPRVNNPMSDPSIGGGRIHGAACHYVDLMSFLVGAPVVCVVALPIQASGKVDENTFAAALTFQDGSLGSLVFTSEGHRAFDQKEEIIISCGGHNARISDYAELRIDGRRRHFFRHRYGALAALQAFLNAKRADVPVPVTLADGIAATRITLAMQASLREGGKPVRLSASSVSTESAHVMSRTTSS